jgi:hypothetical protein
MCEATLVTLTIAPPPEASIAAISLRGTAEGDAGGYGCCSSSCSRSKCFLRVVA